MILPPWLFINIPLAEYYANPVIHPETGETITSYEKLAKYPLTKELWTKVMTIELDNIGQDHKATSKPGTNTVYFLDHNAIKNIPADRENTYLHIVVIVDYRPQKSDLNRVRITI